MRHEDVQAMCEGKEKLSFELAKQIAKKKSRKGRTYYKCPVCRRWHVGRNPAIRRAP